MNGASRYGLLLGIVGVTAAAVLIGGTTISKETDRSRDGLIGPVRQVTIISETATTIATYDRDGALTEMVSRPRPAQDEPGAQEQVQKLVYVYSKGKRVREMILDPDGQQYLSRRYAYDAAGRKMAEVAYHMCGTFSSLHVFSYDGKGRLQEDLFYQYRSLAKELSEYDERGTVRTRAIYRNGLLQSTTRFTVDQQGRISEQVDILPDGSLGKKASYQYDERGNPVEEEMTGRADPSPTEKSHLTYEYDTAGNWTRKSVQRFVNPVAQGNQPLFEATITERTISYY